VAKLTNHLLISSDGSVKHYELDEDRSKGFRLVGVELTNSNLRRAALEYDPNMEQPPFDVE